MSYRLGKLTYAVVSRMVKTPFFALPNILMQEQVVPELLQDDATPEALAAALEQVMGADNEPALAAFRNVQ